MSESEKKIDLITSSMTEFIEILSKDVLLAIPAETIPDEIETATVTKAMEKMGAYITEPMLDAISTDAITLAMAFEIVDHIDNLSTKIEAMHLNRLRKQRREQMLSNDNGMEVQ